MTEPTTVTVETDVHSPIETVWACWTEPEHITQWNHASADWHSPSATNDLRVGGTFTARMEAKDGSVGFDFGGTYTDVIPHQRIAYAMSDGRKVAVDFADNGDTVHVTEAFDAETENSVDMQRSGWQAILDNFKTYTESR